MQKVYLWICVMIVAACVEETVTQNSEANDLDSEDDESDSVSVATSNNDDSSIEENNPAGNSSESTIESMEDEQTEEESEVPDLDTSVERSSEIEEERSEVIETDYGPIRGQLVNGVLRYIDIPYGKIGELFGTPMEPEPWEGVHEVVEHTKRCPQLEDNGTTVTGDIDCLTLSVFTPSEITNSTGVLFHIHDGNFNTGSGDPNKYGPDYFVEKGIIVVLPNYRLGPLGFLCLRDDYAPGNAALKDLTLALDWTVRHIGKFGGNPTNIVVSGEGMAGALVGYLSLSPVSTKYIEKAIVETGSVLSHLAIDRRPIDTALQLATLLSENNTNDTSIIYEANWEQLTLFSKNIVFRPCVENNTHGFLYESPWEILQKSNMKVDFLIGSANHAGLQDVLEQIDNHDFEDWMYLVPDDLHFEEGNEEKEEVANKIKNQYFKEDNITIETLLLYHTDVSYLSPIIRFARPLVEADATVYLFQFSYHGELNLEYLNLPDQHLEGAIKGDIIGYLFKQDLSTPVEGSSDNAMIDLLTDLWVNFIKTGNPSTSAVTWQKLEKTDPTNERWLSINEEISQQSGFQVDRLALWTQIYNEYYVDKNRSNKTSAFNYVAIASAQIFLFYFIKVVMCKSY